MAFCHKGKRHLQFNLIICYRPWSDSVVKQVLYHNDLVELFGTMYKKIYKQHDNCQYPLLVHLLSPLIFSCITYTHKLLYALFPKKYK